jgi:hypothetical protein
MRTLNSALMLQLILGIEAYISWITLAHHGLSPLLVAKSCGKCASILPI